MFLLALQALVQLVPCAYYAPMPEKEKPDDTASTILADLRAEINALDETLITTLAKRFDVVRRVAILKASHNLSVVQPNRVTEVLDRAEKTAANVGLDPAFARTILSLCIDHAHQKEPEWMK